MTTTGFATPPAPSAGSTLVNDIHSQLNPTWVGRVAAVRSVSDVQTVVLDAARHDLAVCTAGGWHAMGGQQFASGGVLIDTRPLRRVLAFDDERGLIDVEAGIQWPELIDYLLGVQRGAARQWGIIQKQTGADRLSIGGALSANAHGRGLTLKPMIGDVEAFTLVDASGELRRCSRTENAQLFQLVIGGYGLFGVIGTVTLRLAPRRKVRRTVEIRTADELMPAFDERIANGYDFGDFQFALDPDSPDFLRRGIFSCYQPVDDATPMPEAQRSLSPDDWTRLLHFAHTDKKKAWEAYSSHYLATTGQIYWSDTHQLSTYMDDYHAALDATLGSAHRSTEMITEIYVPRPQLADFLREAADEFRRNGSSCIYGTVRLIERDDESFLAWAKDAYACTIFNICTEHTPAGLERSQAMFRRLIDIAARRGGSYFLTYHRWATREQVLQCYPQLPEFLRLKRTYDPAGRFQSDWYRHYTRMFDAA